MYAGKTTWFYYTGRGLMRWCFRNLTRLQINGLENMPGNGPLIIVANHVSLADPPLVGAVLPRETLFMAKHELFNIPVLNWIVKNFGGFPVHREGIDLYAMRMAFQVLKDNGALVIFPEGHRSRTGALGDAFDGTGLMASRNLTPILPVGIAGTRHVSRLFLFQRPPITINIGKVFQAPASQLSREELSAFTLEIMRRIAELLPPEQRGKYVE